jgi:hypothetical protein
MKFIVRESSGKAVDVNGTSLVGEITCSYEKICKIFSQPEKGDGYKVDAQWAMKFEDGTIATIYNWKNGKSYCGKDGLKVKDIKDWHIGGNDQKAYYYVVQCLDNCKPMKKSKEVKKLTFSEKLKELVKEFNSLGLRVKARGDDFGVHDFFLELNTTQLSSQDTMGIYDFVVKYHGSIGISPVRGNDCICIRINNLRFDLKE